MNVKNAGKKERKKESMKEWINELKKEFVYEIMQLEIPFLRVKLQALLKSHFLSNL